MKSYASTLLRDVRPLLRLFGAEQGVRVWLGAGLAAITVLAGMALLGLSGWFITATSIAGGTLAVAQVFDVFMPSAGIRLLAMGRTASRYAERLVTHDATLAVLAALRERLFRGWAEPEAARSLLARPAKLLFRLTVDVDALDSFYLRVAVPLGAALAAVLLGSLALGLIDVRLGWATLAWLLLAGLGLALWLAQRAAPYARRRAYGLEALRARTVDLVAGQTELAMVGRLAAQRQLVADADAYLAKADDALNRMEAQATAGYGVISSLLLAGVLLAVGALVEAGHIGLPVAVLALLLVLTATEPMAALRRGAIEWGRTRLAVRRLAPRWERAGQAHATAAQPCIGLSIEKEPYALVLDGVDAQLAPGSATLLHNICLKLAAGERVAVVGPSGAGKSTLLAIVAGEITPARGMVQTVAHCLLTQRTELFQDSVRGNLLLANPGANDAALWAALESAGLAGHVRAMPQQLDSRLGEGGHGLSVGQARRLALARLLLRAAPLWLLDEPTEGLDAATAHDVLQRMQVLSHGHSVLLVTHTRREAMYADRLLVLERGHMVADVRRGDAAFEAVLARLRPD
ncbi:amino acid ABC transporter ATP-binding/permease protein [Variovorax sp. HJSM1_2]|uniref:amino acid ABC transporter ATP-binding/permease protein n=1 Tax=Variovorax sp. HJSM1_2 TaxID=3366263 RepID=UPI003BE0995A